MSRKPSSLLLPARCDVDCSVSGHPLFRRVTGGKGEAVSDKKPVVLYTAAYDSVSAALTDLDAVEQLHKDAMIGRAGTLPRKELHEAAQELTASQAGLVAVG